MLRAGRLTNRVAIQVRNTELGTRGLPEKEWTDSATVWAEVLTLSGQESVQARALDPTATLKVTMRDPDSLLVAHDGLSTKHRIKFGTRYLNIIHIDRLDQAGEFVALTCGEAAK